MSRDSKIFMVLTIGVVVGVGGAFFIEYYLKLSSKTAVTFMMLVLGPVAFYCLYQAFMGILDLFKDKD